MDALDDVNRAICENLTKYRKQAGITQDGMADRLSEMTGHVFTSSQISAWERGTTMPPAAVMPFVCRVVGRSSYDLYPHSETLTERDVRLIATVMALGDNSKDGLYYLLHQWDGDRLALLKLDIIHAVLPEHLRYDADRAIIDNYREAVKRNAPDIDRRVSTDLAYVLRAWRSLIKED